MTTDYYPRLTATIQDHTTAKKVVSEQSEVVLLLTGPILILMLSFAPWILELLYSNHFVQAVTVLRWQVLGDILKILSWPLAMVVSV